MDSYIPLGAFLNNDLLAELKEAGFITDTFIRLDSQKRIAVVESILEEASVKGPNKLTIKEVARRADVSVGSLYQYFNQRKGLLDFAIEIVTRYTVTAFDSFRPYFKDLSLRDALRAYIQGGFQWVGESGGFASFFSKAAYQGDAELTERMVKPVAEVMLQMTRDILEASRARGELSDEIDFESSVRLVNAFIIATADAQMMPHLNTYFQLGGEKMPAKKTTEAMVLFIERALKG